MSTAVTPTRLSRAAIGMAIRAARIAAKLTLEEIAAHTTLSISNLSRSETGLRDLTLSEFVEICAVTNIHSDSLLAIAIRCEEQGVGQKQQVLQEVHAELESLLAKARTIASGFQDVSRTSNSMR